MKYFIIVAAIFLISLFSCKSRTEITTPANDNIEEQIRAAQEQHSAMQSRDREGLLREAAFGGQTKTVEQLLSEGISVDATDEDGRTALMLASYNGHDTAVSLLLDAGSKINVQDSLGRTALMYGSTGPFPETVTVLLEHGADPNLSDKVDHFTALMWAAAEGQTEVARILLEHRADPSMTDKDKDSALSFAVRNKHKEVEELLKKWK
jgi:ankyrin repeat protein